MEENFKSKIGFGLFIFFILFLIIGGYIFTQKVINDDFHLFSKDNENKEVNYKIDQNKDYIYFINEDVISKEANLTYKDVVINIKGEEELTENLERENRENKNTIKYISEYDDLNVEFNYNYDNLYSLYYRDYEVYEFDKYVSLIIKDYTYSCYDLLTFKGTKSYVYNTLDGTRLSENDLLNKYNASLEEIKSRIKNDLLKSQTYEDGEEVIKIDETLNNFNNYSFYINDLGKLCITYLVKSTKTDYNLSMEV